MKASIFHNIQYYVLYMWQTKALCVTPVTALDLHVLVSTGRRLITMLTCFIVILVGTKHLVFLLLIQQNKDISELSSFCTGVG